MVNFSLRNAHAHITSRVTLIGVMTYPNQTINSHPKNGESNSSKFDTTVYGGETKVDKEETNKKPSCR